MEVLNFISTLSSAMQSLITIFATLQIKIRLTNSDLLVHDNNIEYLAQIHTVSEDITTNEILEHSLILMLVFILREESQSLVRRSH